MAGGYGDTVSSSAEGPPLFRETQRFRQWFFYVPLLVVTGVVWWQFIEQVVLGRPQGSDPMPDWVAWILVIVFGLGFPVFALLVRLVTEVRPGALYVGLAPFRLRRILLHDIHAAQEREYSGMSEFGGWGIRVGRDGRAYTAYGRKGIQLTLTDGSRILVGTQQAGRLLNALRAAGANT
ncbi:MAG: hypothetical protein GX595_20790 [Lentisphaerae bacterium]|nr:hypothetical protein [Lentisphaerota bacterium]